MSATAIRERDRASLRLPQTGKTTALGAAQVAAWVTLTTLLGSALRLHALTEKPFWLDEAISVHIARLPWTQFVSTLWPREINMALYYFLLRLWLLSGHSEGFVRAFSVLFSVATIPVIYAVAARLFNRNAGLLASLLLSINAFHIRYAQEARGYALVMFGAVLATWLLIHNLQEPQSPRWGAYAVVSALTAYCHFYGVLVIAAHAVALLFLKRAPWKHFLRSLLGFSLLIIPIALAILRAGTEPLSWVQPLTLPVVLRLGFDFSGNYGPHLLTLEVLAIGMAALQAARAGRRPDGAADISGYVLAFSWLLLPLAAVTAVSLVKPLFVARFLSPCAPALIVLVAAGIAGLRPRILAGILFAAIVACSSAGTLSYYRADFDVVRGDWRAASRWVLAQSHPGDSIFFYQPAGYAPFEFYQWQQRPSSQWPLPLDPPITDSNRSDPLYAPIPGTPVRSLPAGNRVWLVWFMLANPDGTPDTTSYLVRDWFAVGRHRIAAQMFPGVAVTLYGRSADHAAADEPVSPHRGSR